MTSPDGNGAHAAAAAGNWRWLTGLNRTERALLAGPAHDALTRVLHRQFADVVTVADTGDLTAAALEQLPAASFDYILMPRVFDWWRGGALDLLRVARGLLRADGWLSIAGDRPVRSRAVRTAMSQAGFGVIRSYDLAPSAAAARIALPATRAAAIAYEGDYRRQHGGNRVRLALALAGLRPLLYRSWLLIATA